MVSWKSLDEVIDYVQEQGWDRFYLCIRNDGRYIAFEHEATLTKYFDTIVLTATDREEIYELLKRV